MVTHLRIAPRRRLGPALAIALALCSAHPGRAGAQEAQDAAATAPAAAPPDPGTRAPDPAEAIPARATAAPRVHHAPVTVARESEAIVIEAMLDHPELIRSAVLVFQPHGAAQQAAPFLRSGAGYAATIPAEAVRPPGLAYAIEIEQTDGARIEVFASRGAPSPIAVAPDRAAARHAALSRRLGGRTSVAAASAEHVGFGSTSGARPLPCGAGVEGCPAGSSRVPVVDDQYYRVEVGYTYRPLGTIAEFSLRGGVIRGTSLVPTDTYDPDRYEVGINYGAPTVRFRLSDAWHLETELLTSITEVGFSVGTGGALLIGDPYGSRLTLGFETIGVDPETYFGSRFYSRMDIVANERLTVAPIVEVTDMPHATAYGVRLLAAASVELGAGFAASVRGGYQARRSTSGGPSAGGGVSLAF